MSNRRLLAIAAALAVAGLGWWLWPSVPKPAPMPKVEAEARPAPVPPPSPAAPAPAPRPPDPAPGVAVAPRAAAPEESHAHGDEAASSRPSSDALYYQSKPMSRVPHRVFSGWGFTDERKHLGLVGVNVIVDPGITDAELEKLSLDIRKYHRDANAISVRILDDEHAATYDRHIDGGALRDKHQVATVNLNVKLGIDTIIVRDREIKP